MYEKTEKEREIFYVGYDELFGLNGLIKPEGAGQFKHLKVTGLNRAIIVTGANCTVTIVPGDTLGMNRNGRVWVLDRPDETLSTVEQFVASSTMKPEMVEYTGAVITREPDEKFEVFIKEDRGHFQCDMVQGRSVNFGYGKVILVYRQRFNGPRFYTRVIIRGTAKNDGSVVRYLKERLNRFVPKSSNLFVKAQEKALEGWFKSDVEKGSPIEKAGIPLTPMIKKTKKATDSHMSPRRQPKRRVATTTV